MYSYPYLEIPVTILYILEIIDNYPLTPANFRAALGRFEAGCLECRD
jgi:hypothetical protein